MNPPLLKPIALTWLALLTVGLFIKLLLPPPEITLLIDRSYCPSSDWQQVSQTYDRLYHQHQRQQIQLEAVVLFSSLDQVVLEQVPLPGAIARLDTYGQFDPQRQSTLQKTYPNTALLSCHSDGL